MNKFVEPLFDLAADRVIAQAKKTPYFHLTNYMNRWWLFGGSHRTRDYREDKELEWTRKEIDEKIGAYVAARVHNILSSDYDGALHDHPWPFATVILKGGYFEITPLDQNQPASEDAYNYQRIWRGKGSVIFHKANDRHRLEVPAGGSATTLFFMGSKAQGWGFYGQKENAKIEHKTYHKLYPNSLINGG